MSRKGTLQALLLKYLSFTADNRSSVFCFDLARCFPTIVSPCRRRICSALQRQFPDNSLVFGVENVTPASEKHTATGQLKPAPAASGRCRCLRALPLRGKQLTSGCKGAVSPTSATSCRKPSLPPLTVTGLVPFLVTTTCSSPQHTEAEHSRDLEEFLPGQTGSRAGNSQWDALWTKAKSRERDFLPVNFPDPCFPHSISTGHR